MRHKKVGRKFGRKSGPRAHLLRGLALSLIDHEKITTTEAKAKALRPYIEKLISTAKKNSGDLTQRRLLLSRLHNRDAVQKLLSIIAPRYKERNGGFTRIIKLTKRLGDGASQAQIAFLSSPINENEATQSDVTEEVKKEETVK